MPNPKKGNAMECFCLTMLCVFGNLLLSIMFYHVLPSCASAALAFSEEQKFVGESAVAEAVRLVFMWHDVVEATSSCFVSPMLYL